MKRREFIAALGGATVANLSPLITLAQPRERVRRIGILMNLHENDPVGQARIAATAQALQQLGWTEGNNIRIDVRWDEGRADRTRQYATELVSLAPDVILASTGPVAQTLQQVTSSVPIVFAQATDPVAVGLVESLSQPGANVTGFSQFEFSLSGKLVELLKEVAPRVTRAAVVRNPGSSAGAGLIGAIQGAASSFAIELSLVDARNPSEIERAIGTFAGKPNGGLIVPSSTSATVHRALIIALADQYRLPAIYSFRYFVTTGGLISYGADFGPDSINQYRRAAGYVDRILKGEKPADLPVQAPTKYELVINLKTAKAMGLEVPAAVLARADEVIE